MSENIFGVWKRRFPILRNLCIHLELSQKVILATAILENMARAWGEEDPEDDREEGDDHDDHHGHVHVVQDHVQQTGRLWGQILRDNMMLNMPA